MQMMSAMLPDVAIGVGVQILRQEDLLLDYTIEVENKEFKVHKVVMASVSDYFKVMLRGGMVECQTDRVRLEGFRANIVSEIIDFIYTSKMEGCSVTHLKDLLACAMYLQIPTAITKLTDDLCKKIEANCCFDILSAFQLYNLEEGVKIVENYIQCNIDAVLLACDFDMCSYHDILNLIALWECPEYALFVIIKNWIKADYGNRKQHVEQFMTSIRFCLMSNEQVASVKEMGLFPDCKGPWCDLIEKAVRYHSLPTHQKVLDDSVQTQVRSEPTAVCLVAHHYTEIHSLDREGQWERYVTPNAPSFEAPNNEVVVVNNFMVAFDGMNCVWYIYDPRSTRWTSISKMVGEKTHLALIEHDMSLLVFGGVKIVNAMSEVTDEVEKYDFQTNTWQVTDIKLPVPLLGARAFSIGGSIYVLGGLPALGNLSREEKLSLTRLDCYDPVTQTWESKAPMLELNTRCRNRTQVLELCGETMITVFDREFSLQYYKPSTDQWSVWRHVGADRSPLKWAKSIDDTSMVLSSGNCFFMLNFVHGKGEKKDLYVCEKWTFGETGVEDVESLGNCPREIDLCALFSVVSLH